jgi:hypothetical protein
MMQEKAMVSDALNTLNSGLKTYTDMISQTENQDFRNALQKMRNDGETSQYELYTIAKNKKYYQPAGQASQNEINSLKSALTGNTGWSGNTGTSGQAGGVNSNVGMTGSTGTTSGMGNTSGVGGTGTGRTTTSTVGGNSSSGVNSGLTGGLGRADTGGTTNSAGTKGRGNSLK